MSRRVFRSEPRLAARSDHGRGLGLGWGLGSSPSLAPGPSPRVRLERLLAFERCHEQLAATLLEAARFGCGDRAERRYRDLRARMIDEYPRLRPLLRAYLPSEPPAYAFGGSADDFERLFHPSSAREVLAGDACALLETVSRTRDAIRRYAGHLRALMGEP
ncbi:MAG: hypothetical protein WHU10_07390 [Fimbriimonadales bacterium]